MTTKLNAKQRRFIEEFMIDLNATAAYKRTGYKAKGHGAEAAAARLLSNVEVAAAVEAAMKLRGEQTAISQDRVLRELAKVAFFNVKNALNNDGSVRPISELDDDTAAALTSVDIIEIGGGEGVVIRRVRLADKLRALELLGRHLAMFRERVEVSGSTESPMLMLLRSVQGTALKVAHVGGSEGESEGRRPDVAIHRGSDHAYPVKTDTHYI